MAQQRAQKSGPAVVGASYGLALSATRGVLGWVGFALSFWFHGVRGWCRMMAGREGEDRVVVLLRRKWLVLMAVSLPLCLGTLFAPGLVRTVGVLPLGAVSIPVLVLSVVRVRRLSKRGVQAGQVSAVQPVDMGEWSDVNPRTQAAERAIGDLIWRWSESGTSAADALAVVSSMPPFSQTVVLWCCESNLARFSEMGGRGQLDVDMTGPMLWLFDFTARLRGGLGGGPTMAAESGMRRAA